MEIEIESIDNVKTWDKLKDLCKECRKLERELQKKYSLWNEPMIEVYVFLKGNDYFPMSLNPSCINMKNGKATINGFDRFDNHKYIDVNLKEFYKKDCFCNGEKVFTPICKECTEKEKSSAESKDTSEVKE